MSAIRITTAATGQTRPPVEVGTGWRKAKVKVWTLAIAPLTWVRLVTSSALRSRKCQLIGMSQWCRSALRGHSLPALTDNLTHGAASRHTIAPISHTRPSPRPQSATLGLYHVAVAILLISRPAEGRVGGWVGLSTHGLATCLRLIAVDRVWVEPATSRLRVRYSTTTPLHPPRTVVQKLTRLKQSYSTQSTTVYNEAGQSDYVFA